MTDREETLAHHARKAAAMREAFQAYGLSAAWFAIIAGWGAPAWMLWVGFAGSAIIGLLALVAWFSAEHRGWALVEER